MTTQNPQPIDQAKAEEFVHKVLGDVTAWLSTNLTAIGDRLGLFKELHTNGPATSEELAHRAGIQERYAREWLAALAARGYLDYDGGTQRFALPPEHAPVLAQEGGPVFLGGIHEQVAGMPALVPRLIEAFRGGGGVSQAEYGDDFYEGIERLTNGWFENLLVPVWIASAPELKSKLEAGATIADVGTGYGRGPIKMAQEFPTIQVVGYDVHAPSVRQAKTNAEIAGVSDRVQFRQMDVARGLPESYDVITTFDVIHDSADPRGLLEAIRGSLNPGGLYVCVDINCEDTLEGNLNNPLGAFFYGISVMYCMTTSLAAGGEGLGTAGLPESKFREIASQAGFKSVERLPLDNPFNNVYVAYA